MTTPFRILFLCTHNSARSIMAEAICNRLGAGRLVAESAGSRPRGAVHPEALRLLGQFRYDTQAFVSKSWDSFASGPSFDLIVTVCDSAAAESCPVWPGHPLTVHWGIPDPAAALEADLPRAFAAAYDRLYRKIARLALHEDPHRLTLAELRALGREDAEPAA